jgi:hypothetical protein
LDTAAAVLDQLAPGDTAIVVGASRAAADECAFAAASRRGGLFGVTRTGFLELVTRLALPELARDRRSPMSALGAEALLTRATFEAEQDRRLDYFLPVAHMPGFPRAAARTLEELQLAAVDAHALRRVGPAGADLAEQARLRGQPFWRRRRAVCDDSPGNSKRRSSCCSTCS